MPDGGRWCKVEFYAYLPEGIKVASTFRMDLTDPINPEKNGITEEGRKFAEGVGALGFTCMDNLVVREVDQ